MHDVIRCTSFTTYIIFSTLLAFTFDRQALMCEFNVVQKSNVVRQLQHHCDHHYPLGRVVWVWCGVCGVVWCGVVG